MWTILAIRFEMYRFDLKHCDSTYDLIWKFCDSIWKIVVGSHKNSHSLLPSCGHELLNDMRFDNESLIWDLSITDTIYVFHKFQVEVVVVVCGSNWMSKSACSGQRMVSACPRHADRSLQLQSRYVPVKVRRRRPLGRRPDQLQRRFARY